MTIKQKQALLFFLGYYQGGIDGLWGSGSISATKSFQKDFGLTVDGVCGTETEKALKHAVTYGIDKKQDSTDNNTDKESDYTGANNNITGAMWDSIKYFNRSEFVCKCGGKYCNGDSAEMQEKLLKVADRVRAHFGNPAIVTSGVRCQQHNKAVGGVANSRHLQGKAMDFSVSGFSASSVLQYVQAQPEIRYAYAIDSNHVHMDIL